MLRQFLPHCYTAEDELRELGQASQVALGPNIRVLVWNIFKAKKANWITDFKKLAFDKELVLLQEAVTNAPSDHLFEQDNALQWVMARSFKYPKTEIETGVKTGCLAATSARQLYISEHTEPLLQTRKLLLSTQYPIAGSTQNLLVVNMHAINFVATKKYVAQLEQLGVALADHDGPILLAGDFNTWSAARLESFQSVALGSGLVEAVMARRGRPATLNLHLDHVFYRGLSLQSIESLEHVRSSDHAPIEASFVVDIAEPNN